MSASARCSPRTEELITLEERAVTAQRRLRKFLARSAPGLGQPLVDLRDPESGEIALTLTWQRESQSDPWRVGGLHRPTLEKRILDSVIVESRVFFLAQEDCYLPGVVKALQTLVTPEQARARRPLVAHVAQVVRGGQLMDYINGVALHEDEERRASGK